jgi:hypothetical protein
MRKTVDELASQAALSLAEMGYVHATIQHYKTAWNKVKRWCAERGVVWFDPDQERQLIEDLGLDRNVLSPSERGMLRHVRSLLSLNDHGCLPSFSRRQPEEVPDQFRHVFGAYAAHLQQRGLAPATQRGLASVLRKGYVPWSGVVPDF